MGSSSGCTEQGEAGTGSPEPPDTAALCTSTTFSSFGGLTFPIQPDPLEKSRVLKLPLKLQERLFFFLKI